jgi:hypothetical protein
VFVIVAAVGVAAVAEAVGARDAPAIVGSVVGVVLLL